MLYLRDELSFTHTALERIDELRRRGLEAAADGSGGLRATRAVESWAQARRDALGRVGPQLHSSLRNAWALLSPNNGADKLPAGSAWPPAKTQ